MVRVLLSVSLLLVSGVAMQFKPPGEQERRKAIGDTAGLPDDQRRAFVPGDDFEPIPKPGPHDWLANHPEPGQTFDQFVRSKPHRPDKQRSKLYLQPLGEFTEGRSPPLEQLQQFAAALFMLDVEVLPPISLAEARITTRRNQYTGQTQLLTGDILTLLRKKLPDDACALLGITMVDLYPEESWNFVFGQASLRHRVGVYSFARYDPRFYGERAPSHFEDPPGPRRGGGLTPNEQKLMLRRSCKVLAHETAHMFGIQHCIHFCCLMNGSNHLAESDARPLHLCPVDLRKLHHSVGFDVIERYRRLRDFCQQAGFENEEVWLKDRLEYLGQ
jgi:archaemetzincin